MAPADPESAEFEGLQRINPFLEGRVSCARAPTRTRMRSQDNPFAPPDENAVELVVWSGWAKKGGMGIMGDGKLLAARKARAAAAAAAAALRPPGLVRAQRAARRGDAPRGQRGPRAAARAPGMCVYICTYI